MTIIDEFSAYICVYCLICKYLKRGLKILMYKNFNIKLLPALKLFFINLKMNFFHF